MKKQHPLIFVLVIGIFFWTLTPSFVFATSSLTTSLVSYWKLDETSGVRADSVGTNNLSVNGTGGVGSATGIIGNSALFVATSSQYLSIPSSTSLNPGSGSFTISAWVYLNSQGSLNQDLIGKWNGNNGLRQYVILYNWSAATFVFAVSGDGTAVTSVTAPVLPVTHHWYFVVGWYDSSSHTVNIQVNNGSIVSTAYSLGINSTTTPFEIGSQASSTINYLDGRLDEAGYWSRVLTNNEITTLYNSGNGLSYPFNTVTTPSVTTGNPSAVSSTSIALSGSIVADGSASSTVRGFVFGTSSTLTTGVSTTTENGTFGVSSFSTTTTGLLPNTTYYFMAYSTNSFGTGYGSILSTTTPSGVSTPSIATSSLNFVTTSTINLSLGTTSGGVAPYTYQWYRSATPAFTPGPATLISGATTTIFADTPPSNGPWYYKCIATDSNASATTSNQIGATLENPTITNNSTSGTVPSTLSILGIGDSITAGATLSAGQDPLTQMGIDLKKMYGIQNVTITNAAVSGSQTSDWLPGSSTNYMTNAINAAKAASPAATIAVIMLGTNDSRLQVSSTTYASNMSMIINHLLANGISQVIVNDIKYVKSGAGSVGYSQYTESSTLLITQYNSQLASLVNGSTILAGDHTSYIFFQDNQNFVNTTDFVHPTVTGAQALGMMWGTALVKALGITMTPISSLVGSLNQNSATTTLFLANWASIGGQTVTITSNNSSDIISTSTGSSVGSTTVTLPYGASFLTYAITRSSPGTSLISISNAQGWNNPSNLSYIIASSPSLTTNTASSLTKTSAILSGSITSTGGVDATQSGFAYSTDPSLSTNVSTTTEGAQVGTASFSYSLSGLTCNTTYYNRAYVTNSAGTSYGSIQSFVTPSCVSHGREVIPSLTATLATTTSTSTIISTSTSIVMVNSSSSNIILSSTSVSVTSSGTSTSYTSLVSQPSLLVQPSTSTYIYTRNLTLHDTGNDVTALQKFLMRSGYAIVAGASGYFGIQTRSALAAYQKANDINPPSGYFGPLTRTSINGIATVSTSTNITSTSSYQFIHNLHLGDSRIDVQYLQVYLNTHGFSIAQNGPGSLGNETNYFGPETYSALIRFQNAHVNEILTQAGLTQGNGYFGEKTRAYVNTH